MPPRHSVNNTLLYSGLIGPYDDLREIPDQTVRHDAKCFTDQDLISRTWQIEKTEVRFPHDPVMSARYLKIAQKIPNYKYCIYLDAAFQITSPDFIKFMLNSLDGHEMLLLKNPLRSCLYEAIEVCLTIPKCNHNDLRRQRAKYQKLGIPRNHGLWAAGCFAFINSDLAADFRSAWWREMVETSNRDQISLPYVVLREQFRPHINTLDIDIFNNPFIKWFAHNW
jgi:hypothetical protein